MDTLPPQAPPAYVAHVNQAAVDSLLRLHAIQDGLVEQQDALPDLPPTPDVSGPFVAALDAFWEAPVAPLPGQPVLPRRQALARHLAQAAAEDAALRHNDGTLAAGDLALVRAVVRPPDGRLPAHELLVGKQSYAGALVLQDHRDPRRVLLFTVEAGWRRFDSLDALYDDVERTMRQHMADNDALPGIGIDDMETIAGTHFLDIRAIDGEVFDTLARRLIARLHERVALSWAPAATADAFQDALHDALDLHALLDVHGIVRHRDLALAARHDEERLAGQPAAVRDHWRLAAADYRDGVYRAQDVTAGMLSLESFTLDALTTALHRHGIAVPPHDLRVRLSRRTLENGPIATAFSGFAQDELPLPELARRNLGATDGLEVIHADGSSRADVPASVLRQIVRDLDLPNAYARHLDDAFGDTPQGRRQRKVLTGLMRSRMRFQAAEARLAYYDRHEPRSFRDSHDERGFRWVQAVLDHPAPRGRARVNGHEIVVHQLTYQGTPLSGVFLIGARQAQAVAHVVLYTPDAPDGIAFREFADRRDLTRDFLLDRRFESYLLERLPAAAGEPDPRRPGQRRFRIPRLNGDRSLGWIFPFLDTCPTCTELADAFAEREVATDFLDVAYDHAITLARLNASAAARSTRATDAGTVWDVFWNWNLPVQLTRELVGGVVRSVPHTAQAAWRFYDHVKAGESTEAFLAFVDAYTAGLNVLPLFTHVPVLAGARVRAAAGSRAIVSSEHSLPAPDTLFPKSSLARDVAVPASEPASGVFHVVERAGARRGVIRQDGKLYHVRFDKAYDAWRLDQPGNAAGYGPAIERAAGGRWRYRKVGLRGGNAFEDLYEVQQLLADEAALASSVAALSESQRVVLISNLNRSLPFDDFALTLRTRTARQFDDVPLTLTQQQAWNEALRVARATSRDAPALTLEQALGVPGPSPRGPSQASRHAATGGAQATRTAWSDPAPPSAWSRHISTRQRVARMNWPAHVYAYLSPDDLAHAVDGSTVALRQLRNADNILGVPVTTLPPDTPIGLVPGNIRLLLPQTTTVPGTLGDAAGAWVRISLDNLPAQHFTNRAHRFRLYRVPGISEGYYLRLTELTPGWPGWTFSNEPMLLTWGQYTTGLARP